MSRGKVSARLHQMGRAKSMSVPRTMNSSQKIFFSIEKTLPRRTLNKPNLETQRNRGQEKE